MIETLYSHVRNNPKLITLLKITVIVGVIFYSIYKAPQPDMRILLAVAGMVGGVLILKNMQFSWAAILLINFFVPMTFQNFPVSILIASVITVLWFVLEILGRQHKLITHAKTMLVAASFLVSLLISWIAGYTFWDPRVIAQTTADLILVQGAQVLVYSTCILTFIGSTQVFKDIAYLRAATFFFVFIGIFFSILSFLKFPLSDFININALGALFRNWFLTFSVGFLFYYRDMPWWVYLGIGLGIILQSQIAIEGISWMSGWLPPVSSIVMLLFLRFRKVFLPFTVALIVVALVLWQPVLEPLFEQELAGGTSYRPKIWSETIRLTSHSPLFGLGPTNYYHYYRNQNLFAFRVYDPKLNSHNNYLDVYAQMGVVGLTLFLLLLGMVGWVCYKNISKNQSMFRRFYFNSTLAALAGTMVAMMAGDWLMPFVYNVGIRNLAHSIYAWYFLGGALALSGMPASKDETDQDSPQDAPIEGKNFRVFMVKK